MALKELTLFGTQHKIDIALKRIQSFEPLEGYYLAFSGGKDSQVIYELTKMAGVKFDAHFNLTTVDPPKLVYFIKENYSKVKIHNPKISMWKLIVKELMPPTHIVRYCCKHLKERGGDGRIVMTGIRWAESYKRNKRKVIENCLKNKMTQYFNPIIDWTESEVWEFIKLRKLKYCSLYSEGYKRIGCIMCPMVGEAGMIKDSIRYPKYYNSYLRAFDKMLKYRTAKGLNNNWNTPMEVMKWWIYRKKKGNPDQTVIFE